MERFWFIVMQGSLDHQRFVWHTWWPLRSFVWKKLTSLSRPGEDVCLPTLISWNSCSPSKTMFSLQRKIRMTNIEACCLSPLLHLLLIYYWINQSLMQPRKTWQEGIHSQVMLHLPCHSCPCLLLPLLLQVTKSYCNTRVTQDTQ